MISAGLTLNMLYYVNNSSCRYCWYMSELKAKIKIVIRDETGEDTKAVIVTN